jgi:hypothetical protein
MRSTYPHLHLQGNTQKAKLWISWATKALNRIKNLTEEGIANKVLRPMAGVAIHVRSVNNIDYIRIAVAQIVGGCKFPIVDLGTTIVSEFQLSCPEAGEPARRIHFSNADLYSTVPVAERTCVWDFDDPTTGGNPANVDETARTYTNAGTYSPTLTVGDLQLPIDFASSSIESKIGVGATNAAAHADWVSNSWGSSGAPLLMWRLRKNGFGQFEYVAHRATITYNLTGLYILDVRNTAFIYASLTSLVGNPGLIPHGSGIKSDFDAVTITVDTAGAEFTDLTSEIGNVSITVAYTDLNDYSILPGISAAPGDQTGYLASTLVDTINGRDNEYRTTKTIKVDVDGVTKQIGASVHERLSPSA